MGAVLFMLLALILPVAPAGAAGDVEDEGIIVHAANVPNQTLTDECAANVQNQGRTSYFFTLTSSTGVRIPSVNGGTPASAVLIGTGSANAGITVPLAVGDLENRAFPGQDLGNGTVNGTPNGVCTDPQVPGGPNDVPPATLDALANDYGTNAPVFTGIPGDAASLAANTWRLLITAAGHQSVSANLATLVDGAALGVVGPSGGPGGNGAPIAQLPYTFGTGCLKADRGCVVSMGTIQLQALTVPQAGRGSISGTVSDINGVPLGGVEVVLYRQPDQDPTNDATNPIPENAAFSILTDPTTGQYLVNNLWPGRYSVTVADTRIQACVLNANCGIQPATKIVNLFPTGVFANTPDVLQQTVNFAVPTDVAAAQSPGQSLAGTPTLAGFFGYVIDGSSGGRIGQLTPGLNTFNPNGGNGAGLAANVQIVFTPTQPTPCATGLNPPSANSTCIGTVTTATTDQNGRYQVVLVAGVQYAVSITGFNTGLNGTNAILFSPGTINNVGSLPLGFQGSCTVGGNDPTVAFPGTLFPCGVGAQGQDRFTLPATGVAANVPALTAGAWNGGGTFVLVPSNATQIPAIGQTTVRRLEAVIPGIYRNPDTSYTGVDIETIQVRVMNNGVQRTGAQIEWFSTSSDDVASLVKTDTLDLNPGAVGIFTRAIIPDGCTRCMAQIFSIDLDAPTPFLGPGFLPNNTPYVPGTNGIVYGLSDLQATVTHRVVDAGNALAGGNAITFEDLFATGANINQGWTIPLVYKNYGGGVNKWSSVVTGCLTRGVGGPQPIVFQFLSNGETRGGPYQITRSTNPGGCVVLNLNTLDPNDPDYFDPLAGLPDDTYSIVVDSTSGVLNPTPGENAGGMFGMALSYSTTARMAVLGNGNVAISNENVTNGIREIYAPLVFKKYNDWNSGISIAGFRPRPGFADFGVGGGGSGSGASIGIYGEDGTLMGVYVDGISRSSGARQYYLPALPIALPDGFRGSAIISVGDNTAGTRFGAQVTSVNYERNQAMNYNSISQDTAVRAATPNARPCTYPPNSTTDPQASSLPPNTLNPVTGLVQFPTNWVSCLTVPDAQRRFGGAPRGSGATFEVGLGPTTGIRLLNPDPYKSGQPAYILASYYDSAGIVWDDAARTTFSIPAYHTATIFMGSNTSLPDIYDGSMFIMSTAPIVGIGNVVDYRVTDRDASYSFNLPNQSGRTM